MSDNKISFSLGRCCINPVQPVSLAGYFNTRYWTEILDDLEVRVLLLKKDDGPVAVIINYDLITIPSALYEEIIAALQKRFGKEIFNPANILISATHTHTAPEIRLANLGSSEDYCKYAVEKTLEAAEAALNNFQEGTLHATVCSDSRFIFNRRFWMKNGTVVTNPGKLNPDIVRPEGEIDPEIPLMVIKKDAKPFVVIPSIVNHTDTIGGTGVSADWAGFLRRTVEEKLPEGAMLLPLVGCSGNINHFDVNSDMKQTQYGEAERIGKGYAETVEKALEKLHEVKLEKICFCHKEVTSASRQLTEEEIAEAQEVMQRYPEVSINRDSLKDLTSEDLAKKTPFALKYFASRLLELNKPGEKRSFVLTGFELGSIFIASMPSEPFTENGLRIRKSFFPSHTCLVAALANGTGGGKTTGGYIPNTWNLGRGGYETTPRSNPFSADTAERLLDAWKELAENIANK